MGSGRVTSILSSAIIILASIVMFPFFNSGADQLQSALKPHCATAGDTFTKVYLQQATTETGTPDSWEYNARNGIYGGSGIQVTDSSGSCAAAITTGHSGAAAGQAVYSNHGTQVGSVGTLSSGAGTVSFISGSTWRVPHANITRFNALSDLVLSILPVILVFGFIFISIIRFNRSSSGEISGNILQQVWSVIIIMFVVTVSPTLLIALGDASLASTTGAWDVNSRFSSLMALAFAFSPVLYVLGIFAYVAYEGNRTLQSS